MEPDPKALTSCKSTLTLANSMISSINPQGCPVFMVCQKSETLNKTHDLLH